MVAGNKNELKPKPWEEWPFALICHAEVHYHRDSDYDKRLALISFDNSIEISIVAYWSHHHPDQKVDRRYEEKLKLFYKEIADRGLPERIPEKDINRYHKQRNEVYHRSKNGVPAKDILDGIRTMAVWVFEILFNTPNIEQKIEEGVFKRERKVAEEVFKREQKIVEEISKLDIRSAEDREKIAELVNYLDNFRQPYVDSILKYLSSKTITTLSEKERFPIWLNLTRLAEKHRRHPDAKWAFGESTVARIENVAKKLAPTTLEGKHRRLFTDDLRDLYEGDGDWKDEDRKLEKKRQEAIRKILEHSGIEGVIAFAVESPLEVGRSLAAVADGDIDSALLPRYLDAEDIRHKHFIDGFVSGRHQHKGWAWVDALAVEKWSLDQRCRFLEYLPFKSETWQRAKEWLVDDENRYWQQVDRRTMRPSDDYGTAIDKLLEVNRPLAAICLLHDRLHKKWLPPDTNRVVKALLAAVSTDEEPLDDMTFRGNIPKLIKKLQDAPGVDKDDLCYVEWAYLSMLTSPVAEARPKCLEECLATCPEFFFSKVIQSLDGSEDEATKAGDLLDAWKTPPGLNGNDFSIEDFQTWFDKVREQCAESGHLEVVMKVVGKVLFYCPRDPQGLWINQSVAEVLDAKDARPMRIGFGHGIFESRTGRFPVVGHLGKLERKLAKQWRQKADEVDNMGYARFAAELRKVAAELRRVADSYDHDADRYSQGED